MVAVWLRSHGQGFDDVKQGMKNTLAVCIPRCARLHREEKTPAHIRLAELVPPMITFALVGFADALDPGPGVFLARAIFNIHS